ncbi:MAG: enolase superfamily enzyme related to L-alanine-DL-glutamate epimerase [Jatrophihabitantaceae bacterium]|nr:enolase superfamily enzyme related to L-alanine-DL-glutamate epimerase [Jatrophihabitantaceae bacterium]
MHAGNVVAIPMTTKFRGLMVREAVLVKGPLGWAEFSPFVEYDDEEALAWWRATREAMEEGWPAPVRDRVAVNVTVPATDPQRAWDIVRASGCRTAKVKVAEKGQTEGEDIARIEAVRDALGPGGIIRIDVNTGWDVDTAIDRIPRYERAAGELEYVEQPCVTVDELAAVRRKVNVRIAADESIRRAADPLLVRDKQAADIVILKVQPLGGVRACLRLAEDVGLPVVVSSAIETSVGIAAGIALAAALPQLNHACGLATVALLADDVVTEPLLPIDGYLPVRPFIVDEAKLASLAAPSDRATLWLERLARVRALDTVQA